ncbi:MarR family transcriptional regulator [Hamadaea sp. NPDC050747]|uniref:MarR family winged helix-turn-helix transcriptional regulator n=1 Tax=Hamadaea sp. NPDC050747 TaxID=3155789 RepID=UPI003407C817
MDALLTASRAMVALAGRSLSGAGTEVTLPQFRALVVLATRGPQRVVDIAAELGVNPSTGTRMCERLVGKGLIERQRDDADRRQVQVSLTAAGRQVVAEVTAQRRTELQRVVDALPDASFGQVASVLRQVTDLIGEPDEHQWWLGWHDGEH